MSIIKYYDQNQSKWIKCEIHYYDEEKGWQQCNLHYYDKDKNEWILCDHR